MINLKGYKTIIFNGLIAVAGLAQMIGVFSAVSPDYVPVITLLIALANVALRWGTTTGIFERDPRVIIVEETVVITEKVS